MERNVIGGRKQKEKKVFGIGLKGVVLRQVCDVRHIL